jgi:hypothetical protein
MRKLLSAFIALWLANIVAFAAPGAFTSVGIVVDEANEPITGATISAKGGKALGVTDIDGKFKVQVPNGTKDLVINFIGYKQQALPATPNLGTVALEVESQMLADVVVTQSLARTRETPVALSQINAAEIDFKLGNQEFPEILKTTPGVWTTREGGGFGDAKTNMRGFKSANVAVVINGIPINDMEWGGVYWSNWAGLSDVATSIQTQRGLGAGILSSPSIGGTINITTQGLDAQKGGSIWYGMGNDGMNQIGLKVSTGLMKNGWAITLLGSRKWSDSNYVQGTWYNSYNYFVNISKRINDAHQISFTAFGAPQTHAQRSSYDGLTIEGWATIAKQYMSGESQYRYNPAFGYRSNGEKTTGANLNHYHKPQISLSHIWQINDNSSLSTVLYASFANGGGYKGMARSTTYNGQAISSDTWYGCSSGVLNTTFRNSDGTFAYDQVEEMNRNSTTGSNMVVADNINSHVWYGLISTYKHSLLDNKLNLTGGIDMRYYKGYHKAEIVDLYGGDYYMDDTYRSRVLAENSAIYNKTNTAWVYQKLGVGDVVYRNFDGVTHNEGIFVQAEYSALDRALNLVASGSLNNVGYQRIDHFYYDEEHSKSPWKNFIGGSAKLGANYNFDRHNNAFFNIGYISRVPYFSSGVFLSSQNSNMVNPNPLNEKIFSFELGYGYHSPIFSVDVNAYYTKWYDKTTSRSVTLLGAASGQYGSFNMSGVNARHMGIEIAATFQPTNWFTLEGMLSLGDYIWDSNPIGYFYDANGFPLASLDGTQASGIMAEDHLSARLNQKDVKVGGSAMTTGAITATFRPFKGWRVGADWTFNARNYSDYEVTASNFNPGTDLTVAKPWRIPWGNQIDLSASYSFDIAGLNARLSGNVYNLFNYHYVTTAYNSISDEGEWDSAYRVFYSFGRTYALKLRLNF